jgi:hypothetical protein
VPFLLRVELPDVPGSLGRVASAIGEAGGDIEAIEIVEHRRADGVAVDDVMLDLPPGTMPDSIVSACNGLDGVRVLWINRYTSGGQLFLDLEVVEDMTLAPEEAGERLVDSLPEAFRVDWAAWVRPDGTVVRATAAAPTDVAWVDATDESRMPDDGVTLRCALPFGDDVIVLARRGGPEFVDTELARLRHLVGLARTIGRG